MRVHPGAPEIIPGVEVRWCFLPVAPLVAIAISVHAAWRLEFLGHGSLKKKHVHVDVQNTSRLVLKGFKTKLWKLCVIQCKQM